VIKGDLDILSAEIERAHDWASKGKTLLAVQSFALVRVMCVEFADPQALAAAVAREKTTFSKERETYRDMIEKRRVSNDKLVVFADSLGLARPNNKTGADMGASRCYPWLLVDAMPGKSVTSLCQRYYTTRDVLEQIVTDQKLGADADIVIHVGLNDCANRMFTEEQRLSIALLPDELGKNIVQFAQQRRRDILRNLPAQRYIQIEQFRSNLDSILTLLRSRNARKIILATIVLPPSKFWGATPGVNQNFAAYNLEIMAAAYRHDGLLMDIDRHVWEAQHLSSLNEDGMHLSDKGHQIFTENVARLLKA
jgi:lysophospholipase L1-like esterase